QHSYTNQRTNMDRILMTSEQMENKMAVLLGERAAEHIIYGHLSTGAADDLAKITDIARNMVMRYGMDERLGHLSYEEERAPLLPTPAAAQERKYSEDTARELDRAVRELVKSALERAHRLLNRHRSGADAA